jgi:hypothetical protein
MKSKLILSILLSFTTLFASAHKSFISISNMEYNQKEKQIEVSLKLTAHDFEHILENKYGKQIHIENVKKGSDVDKFILDYINKNFLVKSSSQKAKLIYVGREVTVKDELFFYFTIKNVVNPSKIVVKNTFLFEIFEQQQNIIHYKLKGKTKSLTLVSLKKEGTLFFD